MSNAKIGTIAFIELSQLKHSVESKKTPCPMPLSFFICTLRAGPERRVSFKDQGPRFSFSSFQDVYHVYEMISII